MWMAYGLPGLVWCQVMNDVVSQVLSVCGAPSRLGWDLALVPNRMPPGQLNGLVGGIKGHRGVVPPSA
jgi:hypothetical protein